MRNIKEDIFWIPFQGEEAVQHAMKWKLAYEMWDKYKHTREQAWMWVKYRLEQSAGNTIRTCCNMIWRFKTLGYEETAPENEEGQGHESSR